MVSRFSRMIPIKQDRYGSFYKRSLVLTLFVASIPGLIIGLGVYWFVGGQIDRELQNQNRQQFEQSLSYFNEQFSHLELNIAHWSFDPNFSNELRRLDFVKDYAQVRKVFQTIPIMEMSDPLIDHVELYLDEPRPVVFVNSNYTFLDGDGENDASLYTDYLKQPKSIGWMLSEAAGRSEFTLYNKLPGAEASPFGVILIRLNALQLTEMLLTLTPHNLGSAFLMTEQGQWLQSSSGEAPSELDDAIRSKILAMDATTDSFLMDGKKASYSISFGNVQRLGSTWTFVSVVPLSAITEPVRLISQVIVWISLVGLLLATLLSWVASRRLYSPVQRLVKMIAGDRGDTLSCNKNDEFAVIEAQWQLVSKEHQSLQSRLAEQLPYLKEGYLLQLVQGYLYSSSEETIRARMEQYGWEAADKQFIALMVQLSGFANLHGRFLEGDEGLVTFVAANIAGEMKAPGIGETIVINFHDLSIGLLLLAPQERSMEDLRDELSEFSERLIQAIRKVLSLRVTIAVSHSSDQAHQIPYLFEEARQALSYRDLLHEKQIIGLDPELTPEQTNPYRYPLAIENEIVHALRMGMKEELAEWISQFMKELSAGGAKMMFIRHGMLQLLASVQHASMKLGFSPDWFAGSNLHQQLSQLDDPNEILRWFQAKVIGPFQQEWDKQRDDRLVQMVEQVTHYLKLNYMNNISLESCADQIGINSYTLSKAFKQVTGLNFIDYLTGIRMEKAMELLRLTDLRINDIADKVGYQPTYFNRIFKKLEGITPSQFREKNKAY